MTYFPPASSRGLVLSAIVISRVMSAPLRHDQPYGSQRVAHVHTRNAVQIAGRSTLVPRHTRHQSTSNATDPGNRLFPVVVVCIVVGAVVLLLLLGITARFCLSNRAPPSNIEFGPEEKQESESRATSALSHLTQSSLDEKSDLAPPPPTFQASVPQATSVGRGIGFRYDSFRYKMPFQLYQDNYYEKMTESHRTSEMPPPVPSKTNLFRESMLSFSTDSGHKRQSNVDEPCVMQGKDGWDIHQTYDELGDDLSFDALTPVNTRSAPRGQFSSTLAQPHGP